MLQRRSSIATAVVLVTALLSGVTGAAAAAPSATTSSVSVDSLASSSAAEAESERVAAPQRRKKFKINLDTGVTGQLWMPQEAYTFRGRVKNAGKRTEVTVRRTSGLSPHGVIARTTLGKRQSKFAMAASSARSGEESFKICATSRVNGKKRRACEKADLRIVPSETQGSVEVVDRSGYTWGLDFQIIMQPPTWSIATSAPGEAEISWTTDARLNLTNKTPGRLAPTGNVNDIGGYLTWPAASPICSLDTGPGTVLNPSPHLGTTIVLDDSTGAHSTPFCGLHHSLLASTDSATLNSGATQYGNWRSQTYTMTVSEDVAPTLVAAFDQAPAAWIIRNRADNYVSGPVPCGVYPPGMLGTYSSMVWQSAAVFSCADGTPAHP